jgi:hypothetical protein
LLTYDVVAQQQRLQPVARLALHRYRIFARAHQIAQRLVGRLGHVDRRQLSRAGQARELDRVARVGLDALAGLLRRQRRRNHPTLYVGLQPAMNAKPHGPVIDEDHVCPAPPACAPCALPHEVPPVRRTRAFASFRNRDVD